MKTLNSFAALSLSLILGLAPFALIAANDMAATPRISTTVAADSVHALGMEGR